MLPPCGTSVPRRVDTLTSNSVPSHSVDMDRGTNDNEASFVRHFVSRTVALTVEWRIQDKLCVSGHDSGATCRNRRGRGSGHQTVHGEGESFSGRSECEGL